MVTEVGSNAWGEEGRKQKKQKTPDKRFGVRHPQIFLLFFLVQIAFLMRTNFSEALEFMLVSENKTSSNSDIPRYDWEDKTVILNSFYWGYPILQIPAGILAEKYGPRWFLAAAMTLNSVIHLLIPLIANNLGLAGVIVCRVLQGLSEGFIFPSTFYVFSKWAPVAERARSVTLIIASTLFGILLSQTITETISHTSAGWPVTFYIFGAIGLLWVPAWILLHVDSPANHKKIPEDEKNFIEVGLDTESKFESVPWKTILGSMAVWAVLITSFSQKWGFYVLTNKVSVYMKEVMDYDVRKNKILAVAPVVIAGMLLSMVLGNLCDFLAKRDIPIITIRKMFNTIGIFGAVLSLIVVASAPTNQNIVVLVFLIIGVAINAAIICGFQINVLELSSNHAATLMGMVEAFSSISSIIVPFILEAIVYDESDDILWRIVFIIPVCTYLAAAAFYLKFANVESQTETHDDDDDGVNL